MNYYAQFQPTSFEQALGNQYFENVWPETERTIKGALSQSGMAYTPILSEQVGKARGQIGYDISKYLSDLGTSKAVSNLSTFLGIDPQTLISPYATLAQKQSATQGQLDYQQALMQAEADFQTELQKAKQKSGWLGTGGAILGGVGGAIIGGPPGAAIGAGIGGSIGSQIGGGYTQSPVSIGDAMEIADYWDRMNPQLEAEPVDPATTVQDASPQDTSYMDIFNKTRFGQNFLVPTWQDSLKYGLGY